MFHDKLSNEKMLMNKIFKASGVFLINTPGFLCPQSPMTRLPWRSEFIFKK